MFAAFVICGKSQFESSLIDKKYLCNLLMVSYLVDSDNFRYFDLVSHGTFLMAIFDGMVPINVACEVFAFISAS